MRETVCNNQNNQKLWTCCWVVGQPLGYRVPLAPLQCVDFNSLIVQDPAKPPACMQCVYDCDYDCVYDNHSVYDLSIQVIYICIIICRIFL